jgi:hypothetical protein
VISGKFILIENKKEKLKFVYKSKMKKNGYTGRYSENHNPGTYCFLYGLGPSEKHDKE